MIHSLQNKVILFFITPYTAHRIPHYRWTIDIIIECTVCGVAREISTALKRMFRITFSSRIKCVLCVWNTNTSLSISTLIRKWRSTYISCDHACWNRRERSRNVLQKNKKYKKLLQLHFFTFVATPTKLIQWLVKLQYTCNDMIVSKNPTY